MTRRTFNTNPEGGASPYADAAPFIHGGRKHKALWVLSTEGPLTSSHLHPKTVSRKRVSLDEFSVAVIEPMQKQGLIAATYLDSMPAWHITRLGRRHLESMGSPTDSPTPQDAARAAPKTGPELHSTLSTVEYRCPRPGAYDHEQWPSRQGNARVYRDGRRVPVGAT